MYFAPGTKPPREIKSRSPIRRRGAAPPGKGQKSGSDAKGGKGKDQSGKQGKGKGKKGAKGR